MMASWWLAAACLIMAAAVSCWPGQNRRERLMGRDRPSSRLLRPMAVLETLSTPRAVAGSVALLGLGGALLAGPVAGLLAGAYGGLAGRALVRRQAALAATRLRVRSLDALCSLAADLRAGLPPASAGPARIEDRRMAGLAAAAGRLAERTGAPIAELVERIEADARAMDRAGAAAAAQAAGARATAWLLAGLPAGGIALGYGIGVDPLGVLLHTPIGAGCAAGAIVLQVAGLLWADRLAGAVSVHTRDTAEPSARATATTASSTSGASDG